MKLDLHDPKDTMELPPSPPWTPLSGDALSSINPSIRTEINPIHISLPLQKIENDIQSLNGSDNDSSYITSDKRSINCDPGQIPLPPSPPLSAKQSLPFRRPRISNPTIPAARRVSSNARTSSGRRVSGALQYALQAPHREVSESTSLDLAYYQQMREQVSDDDDDGNYDGEEDGLNDVDDRLEGDVRAWDSSVGFGGIMPDIAEGQDVLGNEDEEAWMGYVRQQLNTLFPDLIHPSTDNLDPEAVPSLEEDNGQDVSVSTIATSELPTPPLNGSVMRYGLGGNGVGVPNVRAEITGLSEEIARLRSVVSGLTEDIRRPTTGPPDVGAQDRETSSEEKVAVGEDDVSEAFQKVSLLVSNVIDHQLMNQTATLCEEIIRILDAKIIGPRPVDHSDNDIFSEENLLILKEHLQSADL